MPIRTPVVLSPSRAELGARCHRRHFLEDVADRRKFKSPSAAFGNVIHKGAAAWWLTGNPSEAMEAAVNEWKRVRPSGDKHSVEMAEFLMRSYPNHAKMAVNMPGVWEIVEVEKRYMLTIGSKVFSFQMDRLLTNTSRDLLTVDTKTSAYISAKWHEQWNFSLQQKLYRYGLRKLVENKTLPAARNLYTSIEGVEKKMPFKMEPHLCPNWDDEVLEEAVRLWEWVAEEDESLLMIGVSEAVKRHGKEYTDEQLREAVEEAGVKYTLFNYQDCRSYGMDCPFKTLCVEAPSQRLGILWNEFDVAPVEGY